MALWCRDLPTVAIETSSRAKPVTMIVPYYENPRFLTNLLGGLWRYSQRLTEQLSIIVVDDGSPANPAADVFSRCPASVAASVRCFRIEVDVRWNWLAARNIGFHHAADGWCLVTDIDHVAPEATLETCVFGVHDPTIVYGFSRREWSGEAIHPHSASFFMTRKMFWKIGGYDEALSGYYGTDGEYRRRLAKVAPMRIQTAELVRYEYVLDSSTQRYKRKQPEDAAVKRIVAQRRPGWKPRVLSFPYREVRLEAAA